MDKKTTKLQHLLAGASQSEVARAVGVSRSTVCRWTSGERLPKRRHALRLIAHFGAAALDFEGCYLAAPADD